MDKRGAILVVDDDETIRETLAAILEEEGYVVDTAESGKEALEKSKTGFYNLALLDIRLPDMEGTQLLAAIREHTPRMVKIILTGYPSLENAAEAVNRGADGYLIKPVDAGDLLDVIKRHLKKQEAERKYGEKKVAEFIETRVTELGYRPRSPK